MSAEPRVLSIGSINLDFQARADSWPEQSETLLAHDFLCASGGKAANVAAFTAKLGLRSSLIGCVGDDSFAELALQGPRSLGVDVGGVRQVAGATGVSMIVVRDDGDKTIVLVPNANLRWQPGNELAVRASVESCADGSCVCVDLEIPQSIALSALRAARGRKLWTVLDPSPGDRVNDELLACSSFVVPNARETERLTGVRVHSTQQAEAAGRRLVERGASYACIKLADGGAALVSADSCEIVRAPHVQIVDKTGAGDAFAAGLCAGLVEGLQPVAAMRKAVAAASFAVTGYGSQAAYPTRNELDAMQARLPA